MTITFTHPTVDIPRDRWGRPLIVPVDGGKPEGYTRWSNLAKVLDDKTALTKWKQRQVAIGLGLRPDLVDMALAVRDNKTKLDEVVEVAMTAAESERAANVGTTLHAFSEQVDDGVDIGTLPEHLRADLTAYQQAMASMKVLAKELFVVTDEVKAAGTFDRLLQLPDGRIVVGDIKTGQREPTYPLSAATQIAGYAHGHLYDPERGRVGHLPSLGVSTEVGILIHLPAGAARCDLYELDLRTGWALAQAAYEVKRVFSRKADAIRLYHP